MRVDLPFDDVEAATRHALKLEGFGIITEIDVQRIVNEKLRRDFRRYVILGACNPSLAYRALSADPQAGLLLPCNLIVYEDSGATVVSAIDPESRMGGSEHPEVQEVAKEVSERLRRVLKRLEGY